MTHSDRAFPPMALQYASIRTGGYKFPFRPFGVRIFIQL